MARHPSESLPSLSVAEAWTLVGEAVEAVEPIGMGTRSRVYRIELADGTTRVARLTPRGSGRTAREAWVRRRVGNDPDVPLVHATAVTGVPLAALADVTLMTELPGETLHVALSQATDDVALDLWERFGAGLGALHSLPVAGYGLLDGAGRGAHPTWREAMEAIGRAALDEARSSALVDLCPAALATLQGLAPSLDAVTSPRLLHGDAQTMNVQVARGRIVAWMDFEFALGGDPLYELAYVAPSFDPAAQGLAVEAVTLTARRTAFIRGYAGRSPWPDEAPRRSRCYRIVHTLRGAEYLRVVGPRLTPAARETATEGMRAALAGLLEG